MKKLYCLVLLSMLLWQAANACTTFFLEKNGQMVFGKNYDWITGTGMIHTNLRGLAKSSLPLEKGNALHWTSRYGSTTFNQYGKEFPNGGMNETGLVVELMWLTESEYPAKDKRPALSVLQWIQYQLDNCSTIDEVIATDKMLRITSTGTPQHYLVADSKGQVATIEFLEGKMVIHRGNELPYPVLANSTYQASLLTTNKTTGAFSTDRFSTACQMVQQYWKPVSKKPIIDYSFDILNKVAQPGFTKWSIVYDITNRKVYFKTASNIQVKSFALTDFDYACSSSALYYNVNKGDKGNISRSFATYSSQQNKLTLKTAFKESGNTIQINEQLQNLVAEFPTAIKCDNSL